MSRQPFPATCLLCLCCCSALQAEKPRPAPRDWKKAPALVEVDSAQDIYALGDVHGDYERLVNVLVAGKLIAAAPAKPEKVRWKGDKAVLVLLGDLINKGDQSVRVLLLVKALQSDAAKAGGRVIVVMGNHEAEFLAHGSKDPKGTEFLKELQDRAVKPEEVVAGTDALGLGEFLRSLPFAARVDEWFFAHAGNTQGRSLTKLRSALQKGVEAQGYAAPVLLDKDSLLEARLHPRPWWERDREKAEAGRERLAGYLKELGVQHLVIGHQPGKVTFADGSVRAAGQMSQQYDGLIFLIDVGMSRAIGHSTGALLHIHQGKKHSQADALYPDGTRKTLWRKP